MKVVINKCYGGFGVSTEALIKLLEKNAKCLDRYTPKQYYGGENEKYHHRNKWETRWKEHFSRFEEVEDNIYVDTYSSTIYKDGFLYSLQYGNHVRIDNDLIEVIETLKERSYDRYAHLKVIEIPDDIEYEIYDNDGIEHIAEKHRTWY